MSRGKSRPAGGRPPGRRGKAGVGPGPGYRSGGTGKGTSHKSSSSAVGPVAGIVYAVAAFAVILFGSPLAYLVWAYTR